jgi:parallel beta-helix repeat protein
MNTIIPIFGKSSLLSCAILILSCAAQPHNGLVVSVNKAACPQAQFTSIQAGINAAKPGDSIRVCKGLYREQLVVKTSLSLEADNGVTLMPSAMVPNTASLTNGAPIAAAIVVSDATDVDISGFIVDGTNAGISACAPILEGIIYQNASGRVIRNAVRNFKLASGLTGCQSGTGIFVQSSGGQASIVEISDCTIHDYQKNGITANEIGTAVFIGGNVVTGLGLTNGAAQNGIQVGFGARGSILRNAVTNNIWSGCTSLSNCSAVATGILVTGSDGVEVSDNRVAVGQVPIYILANNAVVRHNQAIDSNVLDDIRIEGSGAEVRGNQVFNGSESGIYIMGNNNSVEDNRIFEAAVGIFEASGAKGNRFLNNQFLTTPLFIHDPPSASLAAATQPDR